MVREVKGGLKTKSKKSKGFSLADVNRQIDSALHQHFPNPVAVIVDGVLHILAEVADGTPLDVSLKKFVKYNAAPLVRGLVRGKR